MGKRKLLELSSDIGSCGPGEHPPPDFDAIARSAGSEYFSWRVGVLRKNCWLRYFLLQTIVMMKATAVPGSPALMLYVAGRDYSRRRIHVPSGLNATEK